MQLLKVEAQLDGQEAGGVGTPRVSAVARVMKLRIALRSFILRWSLVGFVVRELLRALCSNGER